MCIGIVIIGQKSSRRPTFPSSSSWLVIQMVFGVVLVMHLVDPMEIILILY